jgi:CHAT domain-containing protein
MEAPRALTGPLVTKQAVLDALQGHRRLHIATHGNLPVSTPSFQTLYLSVESAGDVLYAYEILRLDLKGVDLVTLSACETALGRVDISDNLRGFPASLLTAGVSTIIGTLWPVETTCARYFFVRLYTALHGGASKGEAFRKAQVQTRRKHPQYRDWGAFYLTGAIA